ncbi:MAG: site-specific DNA-methyltransferase [Candidatus Wallbacteria bacterium]|nr:site-specific DNA-methyltransferase [Candidatus Wallbacteria bacterium]
MPTTEQRRDKLMNKLKELFQLDQPDLDFGFYRIMHAKADQIKKFIEEDLLKIIEKSFDALKEKEALEKLAEIKQKVVEQLGVDSINDKGELQGHYASTPLGREYLTARKEQKTVAGSAQAESDIFDHLYRFFERYYEGGDFISRRYFTSETSGKAAPYAIPYSGEEVKLHWANADQYYIKTAEYFSNFTFNLAVAARDQLDKNKSGKDAQPEELISLDIPEKLMVHFRIKDASEGEHGNVKETDNSKRFFIIHEENPIELSGEEGLVINFEYRPDPDKSGQEDTHRKKLNTEAVARVLKELECLVAENTSARRYLNLLKISAPTEKEKKRPLLAKYIYQYTSRNTMDYFIHKDLGTFLRRELDFYIKNEVMRLDDIEKADVPAVETYLAKIKVLRLIAGKLIDFLAQLEDFQKKLWLKKKIVVETNYCITLDRVPEELYPEISANEAQHDDWVILFAIDEIEADTLSNPGYVYPMTIEFLKANNKLVIDTRFFDEVFKTRLVASIENFDEKCDGLLIHSENFQALNLLQERYREQAKCVYFDPPYNTGGDGFFYKDTYQHSSWLAGIQDKLIVAKSMQSQDGSVCVSIDDNEMVNLSILLSQLYGEDSRIADIVWQKRYSPDIRKSVSDAHEYILIYALSTDRFKETRNLLPLEEAQTKQFSNPDNDPRGPWKSDNYTAPGYRPNQMYEITSPSGLKMVPPAGRCWMMTEDKYKKLLDDKRIIFGRDGNGRPAVKRFLSEMEGMVPWTWWDHGSSGHSQEGLKEGANFFGRDGSFTTQKPMRLIKKLLHICSSRISVVLDYYSGSGTTGHAVINLNREDGGKRKYILVEMGDYFDTVLKPRIAKVVYSESWKDGKPVARHTGISHCFKYLRLESYEDTLNNLRFEENLVRNKVINDNASLKEDFMLRYFLNVETQGSNSLLNLDAFADPTAYTLKVKKPGSDEYTVKNVDLIETFNYLIGLRVNHIAAPQTFTASFKRNPDPELPEDQHTKLVLNGKFKQDENGKWWFRKVEGWIPKNPQTPNDGQKEKVLIVWRKLTGNLEQDNQMLDEWMDKQRINSRDFEFDLIYVNGSDNLPNIRRDTENWKVKKIEEEFMKRMWDVER